MFVQHHNFHIKSHLLRNNIISKSQTLLRAKEKFLALGNCPLLLLPLFMFNFSLIATASIRFFRSVVKLKDDAFMGHIIQNRLFEPLFKVFEAQKSRNNLINSALLELFEFLRQENLKKLISHVVDNYASYFEGVAET